MFQFDQIRFDRLLLQQLHGPGLENFCNEGKKAGLNHYFAHIQGI
jgi:hypothetical protein